jgi:hypothetical protein
MRKDPSTTILASIVLVHLALTVIHGVAHVGAAVSLDPAALAFVILVIQLGPLAGLAYMRIRPVAGARVVAATMAGALVFGVINHFLIAGIDHVSHVAADWQWLFGSTAVLLALTEAAGGVVGLWCASRRLAAAS